MATGPWEKFKQQEGPWSRFAEQEETPALVTTPAPSTARTGLESVTDIGASLVSGLGGVLELPGQLTQLVPGLYGVGKAITEPATSLREFGEGLKSAGLKAREALRSKALSEAEKEGVLAEFTTAIGQTIKDPALLTSFVAEQLPQLLGPAAAAKVAKGLTLAKAGATEATQLAAQKAAAQAAEKAAVRTGMAMQGVDISSDTLEAGIQAIKAQNPQMTDEQAAEEVINRARLAGLGGAAFSKLGMMLPGGKAIERRMAGLPGAGRVTGALGEAGSEMIEEGGGAFARNVALSDLEPERGLLTGVGTAAGLGAIGGGTLGAAFSGSAPAPVDRTADEREAMRLQQELLTRKTEIADLERQAAEARKNKVPEEVVLDLGIKKSDDPNSVYQQILSKDLNDPAQAAQVKDLVAQELAILEAPKAPKMSRADKMRAFIKSLEGESGGDVSQPVEGATGASVPVAGVPGAGTAAEGVGVVETAGVVPTEQDVGEPAGREGQQPAAVTEATVEPTTPTTVPTAAPTVAEAPPAPPAAEAVAEQPSLLEEPPAEAPAKQHAVKGVPIVEAPIESISLSKDVPQFKSDADEAGIVKPLEGKFERTGVAPIQLWRRNDGSLEVISGRHRFDLAKRSGEETIPAQIHDESAGFDVARAATLDAELNIRDEQGEVKDYVVYFEKSGITEDEAKSRGLLGRTVGQRGWAIASKGSTDLIAAHRAGIVPDDAAAAIATVAPNDARLQAAGIKAIQDGKNAQIAVNTVQAVKTIAQDRGVTEDTGDMFGFDDSAIKEAEQMARVATQKQQEISSRLAAITGAARKPEVAKREGIDIKDPAALNKRIQELRQQRAAWSNWSTNTELVSEIRKAMGKPSLRAKPVETAAPAEEPATSTEVTPTIESVIAQKKELQAQQIVLFEQALKKVAAKYGLKDVAVKVVEDMRDANGAYSGGLIKMALDAQNPVRDIRHEAIHAMKELGFFSDRQWSTLVKRAKSEWIDTFLKQTLPGMESRYDAYLNMFKSQGMSDAQIDKAMVEEAIADAFSYFDANKAPAGLMQSILTRMRKLFKMLREGMNVAGIESAEDIFGKIEQGALEPTREVVQPAQAEKLSIRAPQTEAFKRWFGDSKVVDADGNPLVVYHGTAADFDVFRTTRSGEFGPAIYTTDSAREAGEYGEGQQKPGVNIMPVYVSLQNPYTKGVDAFWQEFGRDDGDAAAVERAKAAGHDGVIAKRKDEYYDSLAKKFVDTGKTLTHYIAFSPEQIKSATGNIGTYSPTEHDIRKSLRTQLPPQIVQRIADTTRPRDEKTHVQRITQALGPKSWSYFRQRALNRYNQLSVYDKRRAKLMGGAAFLADQSAESAALLSDLGAGLTASALGVHDRVGGIPVFKNRITIISNMNGTVKGPVEIFSPLAKLGDPYAFQAYQFWAMVKRGKKYFAQNNQGQYVEKLLEPADIQRAAVIEAELKSKGIDVNAIQKEWIKYNDGLVKFMVDTGVLSKERAAIYTEHADYFPFYRQLDEESQEGPRVFQGISGVKAPKAAKGSEAQVGDFFEVIVRNTQSAIQAGIKNVAAERAKKVALEIGMARATHRTSGPDVFSVLENGVPKFYESADPLFIDAIKSLNLPDLPFIGLLSGPANLLRNLVTKDPGFMLANMMRDSMSAYVTSGVKMTPVAATIKNFVSAIAAKDPAFERLLNAGILGGYEFSQNVEASGRQFAKELRKASGKQTLQEQIMRPATWLWEALEKGTTASDAATRIEVYKKTLEETGNEAEAIFRAMEVMNFNRKGSSPVVRIATAAIPFLNARMQGLDVLYRAAFGEMAIKDAKALQRAFFVRGMTIAALSTMYWALTHDDDEYKRQEQETRDNYWLFPSLGIKIPIPFEVGVLFKVIPERIAALTFGTDTAKDFTESMTRNLMNTLAVNPIPQAALPTVEYVTNFSFFTFRPIVGQGLEGVAKPYQIGPGTSRAAQFLGHISKDLPETLQISPMKADALINGYTGSIGTYMSDLIDAIWDMHADSPKASKRFEQMPIIRRFLMDPDARGNVTAYYDLKNAVDRATRTANLMERSNDFEQYGEYMQANMGMFAVKDYILDLEKTMKDYREMKNMVRASNMDANTKRDMVLSITQMENQLTANIQMLSKVARA